MAPSARNEISRNLGLIFHVTQSRAGALRRCPVLEKSFIRFTRLRKVALACLLLVPFCFASDHWDYEETRTDARDFTAGGTLHVRLSVGDLRISRGDRSEERRVGK